MFTTTEYRPLTKDELETLSHLTIELTKLRLSGCDHLCIENFAPELLAKLVAAIVGVRTESNC